MRNEQHRKSGQKKGYVVPISQLAVELGVSTKTVRRWRKNGWLETFTRGRRLMVDNERVDRFLQLMIQKHYLRYRVIENPDGRVHRNRWDR